MSLEMALKDAMSTISHMHANFMLACRDKFLANLPGDFFTGKPGLPTEIRTAPLDGPLISLDACQKLSEIQKEYNAARHASLSRNPSRKPKKPKQQKGFQQPPSQPMNVAAPPQGPPFTSPPPALPTQPF